MIEIEAKLKRWGRSFGVIIPMDAIKEENLSENEKVRMFISKEKNPLKEIFGKLKFKKSTEQMLKESDRESWDE